ncbi:MAG: S49 family peptidase [Gemmatimonadota bacterium]|jgi:protease-4|nr:hypothetical protein [Gemmatimonadota bacterium]MDP6529683.1 S49 family peptidase [Gemmatimonadota bacterium]MDP6802470.1 S49 family peptidase [Gemmatimonadota bacterium]MDP7030974.1 S49 family peptidase [Gemmatimonadota bacterium]
MKTIAQTFLGVILAAAFLAILPVLLLLAVSSMDFGGGLEEGSWLTISLSGDLPEYYPPPTLRSVTGEAAPCLTEILENLDKAAVDERIAGVLFEIGSFSAGPGKLDELRSGILRVRETGKPVHAHAEMLTGGGLYVSGVCDSTFLFPKGEVVLHGRGASILHVKGALRKLDVNDQIHQIGKYKSAAEMMTRERSSSEAIENLRWLVEEISDAVDEEMTRDLDLPEGALDEMRKESVFLASDALTAGLVDALVDREELETLLGGEDELPTVSSAEYADIPPRDAGIAGEHGVAVIHAQGFVAAGGEDGYDPVLGMTLGPDRIVDNLREAAEDDDIVAIILRWDTGGGASIGGEKIARAVARAKAEKPVVVSVGDVAASAGYMMSQNADRIICPAKGITGSIGSITGKFNTSGFWEKLGVRHDHISFGPNAFLYSGLHDFTDSEWEIVKKTHWESYRRWVEEIAKARGMSFDDVDKIGRGRVWTGRQALGLGLVDDLGGFDRAVEVALELAEADPAEGAALTHFPKRKSLADMVLSGEILELGKASIIQEAGQALQRSVAPETVRWAWEPLRIR